MRSRIVPWSFVLLVFGCGGETSTPSTRTGTTTESPAPGTLSIDFVTPSFAACLCHHGRGPGIDGTVRYTIENPGGATVKVAVRAIAFVPTDANQPRLDAQGMATQPFRPDGAKGSAPEISVAPGTATGALDIYADYRSTTSGLAWLGRYTAIVTLEVDGRTIDVNVPAFEMQEGAIDP
jgi:hypothetical protein